MEKGEMEKEKDEGWNRGARPSFLWLETAYKGGQRKENSTADKVQGFIISRVNCFMLVS